MEGRFMLKSTVPVQKIMSSQCYTLGLQRSLQHSLVYVTQSWRAGLVVSLMLSNHLTLL